MKSIAGIIGPIFLALVLTVTLHPIRTWLEKKRQLPGVGGVDRHADRRLPAARPLTLALIVSWPSWPR